MSRSVVAILPTTSVTDAADVPANTTLVEEEGMCGVKTAVDWFVSEASSIELPL